MTTEPVLVNRYRFERAFCEIHVLEHTTSQGQIVFRAAAYMGGDSVDRRMLTDDQGVPYEVLDVTPANAAERLADMLELSLGKRLSGPEQAV